MGNVASYLQDNIIIVDSRYEVSPSVCVETKKNKLVNANSSLPVGVADASWLTNQYQHPHKQHEWVFGVKFGNYYEMPSQWHR